jgi:hypothetical protein
VARELRGSRRLARALQADEHHDRRMALRVQWARIAAEHRNQLVVHDLDERLPWIEAARHFLAERSIADSVHERFGDRQRHVGFEQRHANRPHGVFDVVFSDPAAAGHALDGLG